MKTQKSTIEMVIGITLGHAFLSFTIYHNLYSVVLNLLCAWLLNKSIHD